MKTFGYDDVTTEMTEAKAKKFHLEGAHTIVSRDFTKEENADIKELLMQTFQQTSWNNTRCFARVISDDFDIWWLWLKVFEITKQGKILDDPQATKLAKWQTNRGTTPPCSLSIFFADTKFTVITIDIL